MQELRLKQEQTIVKQNWYQLRFMLWIWWKMTIFSVLLDKVAMNLVTTDNQLFYAKASH